MPQHSRIPVEPSNLASISLAGRVELKGHPARVQRQVSSDLVQQLGATRPFQRRHAERLWMAPLETITLGGIEEVAFVEHVHERHVFGADLPEDTSDGDRLAIPVWAGGVDHVKQQVRLRHLFERCAERCDQRVRKTIDEANRIRHEQCSAVPEPHWPHERVQRGKKHV